MISAFRPNGTRYDSLGWSNRVTPGIAISNTPALKGRDKLWRAFSTRGKLFPIPRIALRLRSTSSWAIIFCPVGTGRKSFSSNVLLTWLSILCLFVSLSVHAHSGGSASLTVHWTTDPQDAKRVSIEVSGFSATARQQLQRAKWTPLQWQQVLAVYAGDANLAMLGSYRMNADVLQFLPQFPLEPGMQYRAVVRALPGNPKATPTTSVFQLPARDTTPTTVVRQIYPSTDALPENLLKFYLHFSAPMQRGNIYEHIHLRDSKGKPIELPFLEIDEELWDTTMTRLTLFIDPGRIKRGVLPLEEIGPSLEAGKSYSLVINRNWKDGEGNPLKEEFQKTFRVVAADRTPPDPAKWQLTLPSAGTLTPLKVDFTEPMDNALAQRVITVVTDAGQRLNGTVALQQQEQLWVFTPAQAWPRGKCQLVIQTTLEDLAGNNIGKPFDVDIFEGIDRHLRTTTVRLPFEIR